MTAPPKFVTRLAVLLLILACTQPLRAQSQPIQYYYDDLGRLVTMVDSSGNVATYVYDPVGNLLQIRRSTVTSGSLAIFDFTPESGPAGIAVTISGQGFSATPTADLVKFNGTVATVTSATTTTLVATVPTGATTGPISVTVDSNTAKSSMNFVVTFPPVISSVSPKSALFYVTIKTLQANGVNFLGATFLFNQGGPSVSGVSIDPTGTSATMAVSAGSKAGTFALVASSPNGNSGYTATMANRFTVVDPNSTADSDGDGFPDVAEAAYGTDPLDPNSFPTGSSPPLSGEANGIIFSALNTSSGGTGTPMEADAMIFSVLNTSSAGTGTPMETDATIFSVLDTAAGANGTPTEADAIIFSVQNNTGAGAGAKSAENLAQKSKSTAKSARDPKSPERN